MRKFALGFAVVAIGLVQGFAHAEFKEPDHTSLRVQLFQKALMEFANEQAEKRNPLPAMVAYMSEVTTDTIAQQILDRKYARPLFRDELANQTLDVIIREKGKYPILIGEPGVGKTALTELVVYKILARDFPDSDTYNAQLANAVVLRVSARNFIPGGKDISAYLSTVKFISESLNRKIIVQIFESHFLEAYHVSVLREIADSASKSVPVILETDSKSYGNTLGGHPSFKTIARPIMVPQFSVDETKTVVKEQLLPRLKSDHSVEITDEVLDTLIDLAKEYGRDAAEPRRSLYLAEEFAIDWNRHNDIGIPSRLDLYKFVARQSRLPVIPQNEAEFSQYMEDLRGRVKARVVAQDVIVDGLIDQFRAALTSRLRQHSVAMIMGPTGVGKTLSAEVLAEEFFGDVSRVLELDMTQFGDTTGLNTLFGAANGYISSDKEKGVICEFLDGAGRGGGVLILNEIEEAHGEVITRMMELFDKGVVRCGDGRVRYLGRSLVVMTSNKNTDRIMSYDSIKGMDSTELQRRLGQITQEQLKKAFTEKASYTQSDTKVVKSAVLERVDKFYFAAPLLLESAVKVAQIEIGKFVREYNKQGTSTLEVDAAFAEVLTGAFYNESLGARQLRTAVQQSISNAIAEFKKQFGFEVANLVVSANLHPTQKTISYVTVKAPGTENEITIDGPRVPVKNKMMDAEFRKRLVDLEANLKSEVFGQDEAINAIASAVKSRFLRGGIEDVVAGFLLGSTGSGKSQLGKSVAKFLFGREEAVGLFEMGKIQSEHDMSDIFSPPKGIIGSDQPGQLEQFLIQYPDGGVLLFDEMSNAGGANRALKESIAKQFYTMLQEGIYRSPSGKVYDISKYLVLFTGNDGEEVFKGLTSDSMLEEAYREAAAKPELVRDILRRAGFSDAFLGRLAFAKLMRPTLSAIKVLIAKKMLDQWKTAVEAEQPFDIIYDDKFTEQIGILMFSPKAGARSINQFIASTLGQAVANEALLFDWDKLVLSNERAQIRLSLSIDQAETQFYETEAPYENHAILHAEAYQGGEHVHGAEIDFSSAANFPPQVHRDIADATAVHEMGHWLTSFTSVTGKKPIKVTISPEKIGDDLNALGYAQYRKVPSKVEPNRDFLLAVLAGLLAGSEAEQIYGRATTTGRSNDAMRVGQIARQMVLDNHLIPELDSAHAYVDKDGQIINNLPEKQRLAFDTYVDQAIEDARKLAQITLKEHWHVILAGRDLLLEHGNLSEKDLERLAARANEVKPLPDLTQGLGDLNREVEQSTLTMPTDGIVVHDAPVVAPAIADCERAITGGQ